MSSAGPEQTKSTRVLACALCKQRRVKCNRSFPCTNCVRAGVPCLQPPVNQRRRRFAERELLDHVRHYESLLRQNNIPFEPLHGSDSGSGSAIPGDCWHPEKRKQDRQAVQPTRKDVWPAIKRVLEEDDDYESDSTSSSYDNVDQHVKEAALANDHLLFGAPIPDVHLAASHPEQVQIFKLWQIYLDNINPLLKVTHTPTLQPRIIDAASDIENISPPLEALMFSIYCAAVLSLTDDECRASFRLSRDYLLSGYQVACKQALLKCAPWRSSDRDCLTALYLYLESVGPQVDPRSLACMVGVAIRIAQRMGIHCESSYDNANCTALEAEMCRRLWWSLALFDHRTCEIVGQEKSTTLSPAWNCRVPRNVNDFEMQAVMKKGPAEHSASSTEALFALVRSELANASRREGEDLKILEAIIQDKHLARCNEEVSLHYMTIWTTRSFLARCRLMEHYSTHAASSSGRPTDAQRRTAYGYAIRMVECNTQLRTSSLIKGYLWLVESWYSPVLAYLHILNRLAKQPKEEHADKAWKSMCDNYDALADGPKHHRTRLMFALKFSKITLQAWEARETLLKQENKPPELPPRLVLDARMNLMQISSNGTPGQRDRPGEQPTGVPPSLTPSGSSGTAMTFMIPAPSDLDACQVFGEDHDFAGSTAGFYPDMSGQASMDVGIDQFWTGNVFN